MRLAVTDNFEVGDSHRSRFIWHASEGNFIFHDVPVVVHGAEVQFMPAHGGIDEIEDFRNPKRAIQLLKQRC